MVEVTDVITTTEDARDSWNAAVSYLRKISFDFDSQHPSLGTVLSKFDNGLSFALELGATSGLKTASGVVDMLNILPALEGMSTSAEQIRNGSKVITDFFEVADREDSPITVNNPNMLTDDKNRRLDLAPQLQQIKNSATTFISNLVLVHDFLLREEMSELASRIKRFRVANSELEDLLKTSQKDTRKISSLGKKVEEVLTSTITQLREVEVSRDEIKKIEASATSLMNEASVKLASIRETATQSDTLREKVDQIDSQFSAFDESLEDRLATLEQFEKDTNEAKNKNDERESEIDRLIDKANQMLQGATNAGLAKSFNDASDKYDDTSKTAKNFFYFSIFLLGVSSIPLASYVFPVPFIDKITGDESGVVSLGGILARAVLLLPTVWLSTFAAHRYSALFQLHREYRFKAAIAMSVEGFKQQAPKYEEEIAGATFIELSGKPEFSVSKTASKAPNPIMAFWIKQMQKRFENISGQD